MLFSLPCSNNEKGWQRGGAGAINDPVEREKTAFLTDTNLAGPRSELMTPYNEAHTDVNTRILGAGPNEAAMARKRLARTLVRGQGQFSGDVVKNCVRHCCTLEQSPKPALNLSSVISAPATGLTSLPPF